MVKIEADGASFSDALSKLHQCAPWDIRLVFFRDYTRDGFLSGCDVYVSSSPVKRCATSKEALEYIGEWLQKHDENVARQNGG